MCIIPWKIHTYLLLLCYAYEFYLRTKIPQALITPTRLMSIIVAFTLDKEHRKWTRDTETKRKLCTPQSIGARIIQRFSNTALQKRTRVKCHDRFKTIIINQFHCCINVKIIRFLLTRLWNWFFFFFLELLRRCFFRWK